MGINSIRSLQQSTLRSAGRDAVGVGTVTCIGVGLHPTAHSMKPKPQQVNTASNVVSLPSFSKALPAFLHMSVAVTFCALFMSQFRQSWFYYRAGPLV